MEGVTILAQEAARDFHLWCFIGMAFLTTIGFLLLTMATFDVNTAKGLVVAISASIIIGLGVGFVTARFENDPIPQYKVTISKEVSMVEFYEKYEIIDQEDLIFTVREKDQN